MKRTRLKVGHSHRCPRKGTDWVTLPPGVEVKEAREERRCAEIAWYKLPCGCTFLFYDSQVEEVKR